MRYGSKRASDVGALSLQAPNLQRSIRPQRQIQFMVIAGIAFLLVFNYAPMFGVVIAFKDLDYSVDVMGALRSKPFVGFKFFLEFFHDRDFLTVLRNTLALNFLQLIINFPAPIIFAILLNEIRNLRFKKVVQTITYFPHFLSWIVFGGIVISMLAMDTGVVNWLLVRLGITKQSIHFLGQPSFFWPLIVVTSLIKGLGWGSIIYLAAISGIDPQLFEAATIDGAGRFQRIWHITLPSIVGTILVFFLLSISNLLNSSFDHIWIFQNVLNIDRSEVIDTFVYKVGIREMRFSYTTAVGLFKSVVALMLLGTGDFISKRIAGRGLF